MSHVFQTICKQFQELKSNKKWSFQNISRKETNCHTHGYHRYPAKFIPQIVQQLIKEFAPTGKEIICDPFGGCGTTLVEAKISGRNSIGFDINPVAKFITHVKVSPIAPKKLENYREEFLDHYKSLKNKSVFFQNHPRINYWFDKETIKELNKIYWAIKNIPDQRVKNFFFCAFSHNLKNSSRWLMKSIKPTIDKSKVIESPKETFLRHLDSMIKKNEGFYLELKELGHVNVSAKMYRKDSTRTLPLKKKSVDLVITSPPYVTSYEYADLHQLSLLWFGEDSEEFKGWHRFSHGFEQFRKQFVGTSFKQGKEMSFDSDLAYRIVTEMEKKDRALAIDIANYFSDMQKAFTEMYRILKSKGKACIIIGNTNMRGMDILNAEIAVEQMHNAGFKKIDFIKREVLNKSITPWRDRETGKFTGISNPNKKRVYQCEYIIVMQKE